MAGAGGVEHRVAAELRHRLDGANSVNAVTELSSLIAAQRAYEMNSKVITAADQMLSSMAAAFRG